MKELQIDKEKLNKFKYLMNRWCIPRLVGSDGSYQIVELLKEDFSRFNFEESEQKFPIFKSNKSFKISTFFFVFSFLSIVFLLLLMFLFWWTVPVGIGIIIYTVKNRHLFLKKNPCIRRIEKESDPDEKVAYTQSNLIYRLKPTEEKKYNVVLIAHHDSKSQYLSTYIRAYVALFFIILIIFAILAYITIIIFERRYILAIYSYGLKLYVFIVGWLMVSFFLTIATNFISNDSPGALDNASGLYTVWEMAQYLQDLPLSHTEVWLILTGAEEIDQEGAAAFLNKYREDIPPNNTLIINFDMIGLKNTPLEVVNSFYFPKKEIDPILLNLINESAEILHINIKGWYLWIGGYTDGFLFHEEGYNTIDFITKEASKFTHQKKDVHTLIDPNLIDQQARLNINIIKNFNEGFIQKRYNL